MLRVDGATGAGDAAPDEADSLAEDPLPDVLVSTLVAEPGLGRWSFLPSLP